MKRKLLVVALLANLSIACIIGTAKADEDDDEYGYRHGHHHRAERGYYDDDRRYNTYYPPARNRPYYNPGYTYLPGVNITLPLPPLPIYIDPDRIFSGRR
jgi:hypothetical protein